MHEDRVHHELSHVAGGGGSGVYSLTLGAPPTMAVVGDAAVARAGLRICPGQLPVAAPPSFPGVSARPCLDKPLVAQAVPPLCCKGDCRQQLVLLVEHIAVLWALPQNATFSLG